MNIYSKNNRRFILMLLDTGVISFAFCFSFLLRFDFTLPQIYFFNLLFLLPVFILLHMLVFNIYGYYDIIWRFTSLWDIINVLKASSVSMVSGFAVLFFYLGSSGYPRSILIIFFILNSTFICLTRVLVRIYNTHYVLKKTSPNKHRKKLILIGAGRTGEKILREIKNTNDSPYEVVGFVDDDPQIQGSTIHGVKVLGTVSELSGLLLSFDELLITAPSATGDQLRDIIMACKKTTRKYKTVPNILDLIDDNVSFKMIRSLSYSDLLGREEIKLDINSIENIIKGKRVLITGAGGSIGSELVRQCLVFNPSEIICIDNNEEKIFSLEQELSLIHI